jgi:hypothetical protein
MRSWKFHVKSARKNSPSETMSIPASRHRAERELDRVPERLLGVCVAELARPRAHRARARAIPGAAWLPSTFVGRSGRIGVSEQPASFPSGR